MKPLIDISHHQNPANINYDKIVANTSGVILRAAYGARVDNYFDRHYAEFKQRNHPMGCYQFITQYHSVQSQIDRLIIAIAGKSGFSMGFWADVERETGAEPLQRQQVINYINAVEAQVWNVDGIYTSKTQWQAIMNGVYFNNKKLWVALYGTNVENWLPQGWSDYWLWQYSSTGRVDGYSGNLDMDRFRYGQAEFDAWIGNSDPDPEPPETEEVLFRAKVTATANLKVRAGAGTQYKEIPPSMPYGTIVDVYEVVNGWGRHSRGGWSDAIWLKPIDDTPAPTPPVIVGEPYYGALYWQRDPRWVNHPLGTSGTIGAYGCAMCCDTNAVNQLGISTNPIINNKWRTENNGYRNGNLIVWEKVSEQHPEIVWEGRTYNPTDAQMLAKVESGRALVILADFNEGTPELNEHWLGSVNRGDGQLWVYDPWDGQLIRLRDRYKKATQQFTEYRRS